MRKEGYYWCRYLTPLFKFKWVIFYWNSIECRWQCDGSNLGRVRTNKILEVDENIIKR